MHVDIACRQYSAGWQVLLVAGNSHEVVQNGRALKQLEPGVWVLESLDPVVVDGRQVSIREQVMIFRLSETVSGYRGKRVENVSRNSNHLIIASDELTIQGSNPVDALGIPGYQSVLVGQNSPVHLVQKDGSDLLVQHEAIVKLELIGHKAPFCSLQTPLFIRDFPSITGETSAPVTIIAGYEGTGTPHWRASVSFNGGITKLPTPPSKLGWFFVRCYDARNVLLEGEGLDFYWIRGMNGISWDSTHAELVFSHDHTLIVDTLSPTLHVQRQSHETRCRLPLGPEHNQTWWRVTDREDVRQYIEVPITVPRNQWGLGPEDSPTNLHWTQEPLVIPANLVKATSTQTLHIAVSREQPLKNPTIILWVGSNRMAPVRLHGDQAMIPLRNLISHVPTIMDRPLPLRFTVASNHQLDNPTTLGQITMMFSCGRCSTEFDSTSALQQHIRQIHPILLKEASTYAAYYSMATRAGLADKLPAKVYRCIRCGHIEVADNPHVNNATSAMDRHFNQEHRGGTVLSLRVINDTAEIAQLFNRILEPLGECPECRSVFQVNHHAVWNAHRDKHYSEWITRR
jgi:DNA-directed RNA polymerase subunit RPC12/RpoP